MQLITILIALNTSGIKKCERFPPLQKNIFYIYTYMWSDQEESVGSWFNNLLLFSELLFHLSMCF